MVQILPVIRADDGKEILQLSLTALCRPRSQLDVDLLGALDVGREWVVRGFTDFTSREMHEVWKRENEEDAHVGVRH